MIGPRNFEFERFVRNACAKNMAGAVVGIILMVALAVFFLGFGIAMPFIPIIVIGLIPLGAIFLMVFRFKGDMKGGEYWVNLMVNEPGKIVWIKPVNIRHTAAYVITLYNEMHFQILTSDGISIMIKCVSPQDQYVFVSGLKQYVPHAHFGYHDLIQFHYKSGPTEFLQELKDNGLYHPVQNLAT
jgi:hypothetical protein